MKKIIFILMVLIGTLSFSDCSVQAGKLMEKVMKEKFSYETDAYLDPQKSAKNKYETTVFDKDGGIVGVLTLDLKTGTVYSFDENNNKTTKIYQDRKNICTN